MKKSIIMVLIALSAIACGGNQSKKIESARAQLSGLWAKVGYEHKLIDSMSAQKAFALLHGYSSVEVSEAKNDTVWAVVGINNHEAIPGYLKATPEGETTSFLFCADGMDARIELSITPNSSGSELSLKEYDKEGALIDSAQFSRVGDYIDQLNPCDMLAARLLYAGTYKMSSAAGEAIADVELCDDLTLKGMDGYKFYYPQTDYMFDTFDVIGMHNGNSAMKSFIVERSGNDLELYETIEDDESPAYKKGQLVYKLTRKQ